VNEGYFYFYMVTDQKLIMIAMKILENSFDFISRIQAILEHKIYKKPSLNITRE